MPVLNVPGFLAQQRYLPIYDRDLNRSFPGAEDSTSAKRMAHRIFTNFVEPCDYGLDFHTSTRGRTNMLHVRADMADPGVARLAKAFGASVIIDSSGSDGMLRTEAAKAGTPTITVELGEAHRFQRPLIDEALAGVESVFAEYGLLESSVVRWPGWRTVVDDDSEKTWIRADAGGIVDVHFDRGALVHAGDRICTITNPFKDDNVAVEAPFTGLLVGLLENPVVYPGNPICHLVELDGPTRRIVEQRQSPQRPDGT
jgi:predicted deacylase